MTKHEKHSTLRRDFSQNLKQQEIFLPLLWKDIWTLSNTLKTRIAKFLIKYWKFFSRVMRFIISNTFLHYWNSFMWFGEKQKAEVRHTLGNDIFLMENLRKFKMNSQRLSQYEKKYFLNIQQSQYFTYYNFHKIICWFFSTCSGIPCTLNQGGGDS